jgi:uncharacterized protein involved in exopolysaccharide biosynthesis
MSFSDSDWTRDPPLRPRMPASQRRVLILAIAIAVSCLAIALAVYGIEQLLDASARDDALRQIGDVATAAPPGAGGAAPAAASAVTPDAAPLLPVSPGSASAPATTTAPAPSASQIDARQLAALEAEMRQRARETAEQAAVEAARRKERAWQRFYQRPDFCADNPTAALMVQCANQYIRARKEFEERYGAGRL